MNHPTLSGVPMKSKMQAEEKKWRTEDDLRTLSNAKEIEKDPERMKACRAMAKERMAQMQDMMGNKK